MEKVITYRGEDIETLSREKLLECIRFCKTDIDAREKRESDRMKHLFG